jgi:hypothetical protein
MGCLVNAAELCHFGCSTRRPFRVVASWFFRPACIPQLGRMICWYPL